MSGTKEIQAKEKQEVSVPAEHTKPGPVFILLKGENIGNCP